MSFWTWINSIFLRQNPEVKEEIKEQKEIIASAKKENTPKTIEDVALSLVSYTPNGFFLVAPRTVKNIKLWVRANMTYKRYYWPRLIDDIWKDKSGDCTDYAHLIQKMCLIVGITDIKRAHGYFAGEKHDWLVFDGHIVDGIGDYLAENYKYVGEGFW